MITHNCFYIVRNLNNHSVENLQKAVVKNQKFVKICQLMKSYNTYCFFFFLKNDNNAIIEYYSEKKQALKMPFPFYFSEINYKINILHDPM